jgi:hypothetical protein
MDIKGGEFVLFAWEIAADWLLMHRTYIMKEILLLLLLCGF